MIRKLRRFIRNQNLRVLSYKDILDICFLLLPYLKLIKVIKEEYHNKSAVDLFKDVVDNILSQLDKTAIDKILRIVYKNPNKINIKDLSLDLPYFIGKNNLVEIFILLKELGAYD